METNLNIRGSSMRRTVYQSALNGVNWFLMMMSFIGMIILGSILCVRGDMQIHEMMLAVQMMNGISWMFSAIGSFITQMQGSMAGAERIFAIMDAPAEPDFPHAVPLPDFSGLIEEGVPVIRFDEIDFAYTGSELVLKGFTTQIGKDATAAVVGLSGSGKSTLFKLLLGFYRPTSGSIKLFGRDIHSYSNNELRGLIAYVPQESYLFSGTIRENIAYGRIGAAEDEILEAAKAAYAHDFISELPEGYDTQVGERGARLSGGQRQRIAIARALLKNAPILLLDEATAALDSESEQQVQMALEALMKGRTTIAVAHRLSTIRHAEKILVLDSGTVVEEGNHESLLGQNGAYARLYNLQFRSTETASVQA